MELNEIEYKILELISRKNNITRTILSKEFTKSPAFISKTIKKLIDKGYIVEGYSLVSSGGRPQKNLFINKDYKKVIGLSFGTGYFDVNVSDLVGNILETKRENYMFKDTEKILTFMIEKIEKCIEIYGKDKIAGIGISINGPVNNKQGIIIFSPHLKFNNVNLKEIFEKRFNLPVIVDNDVRSMLIAEDFFSKEDKLDNVILLYMKDGIGSSLMINGQIFNGANFCSGEIGHYVFNPNSNYKCKCGKYGCFEEEFSVEALNDKINWEFQKMGCDKVNNIDRNLIFEKAYRKEKPYHAIIKQASFDIGKTIGNIINVIDIGNIIVAGLIVNSGKLFFDNFRKGIDEMVTPEFKNYAKVVPTKLGDQIEKYGSVALVLTNLFINERVIK